MVVTNTKEELLSVAQDLVQQRGFNAFSFRDLSERVGIRTASIHHHFPTKADLGVAMVQRYRSEYAEALTYLKERESDPKRRLSAMVKALAQVVCGGQRICLCGVLATDFITLPREIQREVTAFFDEVTEFIEQCIREGKKSAQFKTKQDPSDVAATLLASLQGLMIRARTQPRCEEDFEKHAKLLLALL